MKGYAFLFRMSPGSMPAASRARAWKRPRGGSFGAGSGGASSASDTGVALGWDWTSTASRGCSSGGGRSRRGLVMRLGHHGRRVAGCGVVG